MAIRQNAQPERLNIVKGVLQEQPGTTLVGRHDLGTNVTEIKAAAPNPYRAAEELAAHLQTYGLEPSVSEHSTGSSLAHHVKVGGNTRPGAGEEIHVVLYRTVRDAKEAAPLHDGALPTQL